MTLPLRLALSVVLLAVACGESSAPSTPCAPACAPGETCTLGVCVVACNPRCAAGELCVAMSGASACVRADGGTTVDVATDHAEAGIDATLADGGVDAASPDAPTEAAITDDLAGDRTVTPDVHDVQVAADVPAPMDTHADGTLDVPAPMDVLRDVAPDAPADRPVDLGPPPCGNRDEICCGVMGAEVACRAGRLCNAFTSGRCIDITAREPGECVSNMGTPGCGAGRVCSGPTGCGDRWCYRCTLPGTLAFDATCDPVLEGRNCNTGVCQRGRCTSACTPGSEGDAECRTYLAGARCVTTYYGLNLNDAGQPQRWATLGSCVPGCARNSDCTGGRVCVATSNLLQDRVDFVCLSTTRPGAAGAACTNGGTCQSGLCIQLPDRRQVCTAPCIGPGDCPAGASVCREISIYRPVTGDVYIDRGCLPP